jgi:cyclomaltodextrinase / maltogenic alpha-amylase / neopullulanase
MFLLPHHTARPWLAWIPLWGLLGSACALTPWEAGAVMEPPLPITPLEIIPTQEITTDEVHSLDLGLFFILEACELSVEPGGGLEASWEDEENSVIELAASGQPGLTSLRVTSRRRGGEETASIDIPIRVEQRAFHEFRFHPDGDVESLSVAGTFNGWSAGADPMTDEDGDGDFTARLPIEPGRYLYKYVLNGEWIPDPDNPEQEEGGYGNSILVVEGQVSDSRPQILRREATASELVFSVDEGALDRAETRIPIFHVYLDNMRLGVSEIDGEGPVRLERTGGPGPLLRITLPPENSAEQVRILGLSPSGDLFPERLVLLEGGWPVAMDNPSDSWRATVLYYAFVDRFSNGDPVNDRPVEDVEELPLRANWNGGDLQGVLDRIEEGYFSDLGVTCIWLSPLNRQPDNAEVEYSPPNRTYSSYHGYWPVRDNEIEPRFGDEDLLRRLVAAAHERGIRVILDCVANHVHEQHPLFTEHRDWFGEVELPDGTMNIKLFDAHRLTTWFDTFLPSFDYPAAPEAVEHMTDNAVWWLQTFDLDGFRHDATKHIPDEFWQILTRKIRIEIERPTGRRLFQVGETISGRDLVHHYATGGMLDGQFDFPLYWPTRNVLGIGSEPMTALAQALEDSLAYYGPSPLHSALLGNHDVSRFMAYADGVFDGSSPWDDERTYGYENDVQVQDEASYERLGVGFAFLLTIPHVPMIYYGDEVGITGAQDPDNRRMMEFDDLSEARIALRERVSRLAHLRREHPALWQGDFLSIQADEDTWVYARVNFDEVILVALNRSDEDQSIEIALPDILGMEEGAELSPLLDGESAEVGEGSTLALTLSPRSSHLLLSPRN